MASSLWRDYRDRYKLMQNTRGRCGCVDSSMGTWLRLRLGKEWYVATHMQASPEAITLLRYDSSGLQWQVTNIPTEGVAMVRLVGVSPGMVGAHEMTDDLSQQLNEEY